MTPMEKLNELLQRAAEALNRVGSDLGDFIRAMVDFVAAAYSVGLLEEAKIAEEMVSQMENALKEAPPRVRHLAQHSKKYRTRKKNIDRALRLYSRTK